MIELFSKDSKLGCIKRIFPCHCQVDDSLYNLHKNWVGFNF